MTFLIDGRYIWCYVTVDNVGRYKYIIESQLARLGNTSPCFLKCFEKVGILGLFFPLFPLFKSTQNLNVFMLSNVSGYWDD